MGIIDHGELIALGTQAELTRQVGENDTLDPAPRRRARTLKAWPRPLAARCRRAQGDVTDHTVTVIAPEAEEILAPVITKANELGIKIRSVDIQEPNLEAVFLHLTGRACAIEGEWTAMKKNLPIGLERCHDSSLPRPGRADPDAGCAPSCSPSGWDSSPGASPAAQAAASATSRS